MVSGIDLSTTSHKELLLLHAEILDELKRRGVVRTKNNPVGDYAEWLVKTMLGHELEGNSNYGYDSLSSDGIRYQIKARRVTASNPSRQLSVIRNLEAKSFDKLIAIIFAEDYAIDTAVIMPHEVIADYASYRERVNGHVMHLRGKLLQDERVKPIERLLKT